MRHRLQVVAAVPLTVFNILMKMMLDFPDGHLKLQHIQLLCCTVHHKHWLKDTFMSRLSSFFVDICLINLLIYENQLM